MRINIFQFIASLFSKSRTAEKPVSAEMQTALEEWLDLYQYGGGTEHDSHSLDLAAAIASEFARLVLAENDLAADGTSKRAKYLNTQFQIFLQSFADSKAETAFALGSMAFKPYVSGGRILVDMVRADRFVPTEFDDTGTATAAVFMARKVIGQRYYTRLETHTFDAKQQSYTVESRAYCSLTDGALGQPCSLGSVPGWETLKERQTIQNIEHPLFAVFRNPASNTIDMDSAVGVSVFAHAAELIRDANAQWARILWEYKATEAAIDASEDLFRKDRKTGRMTELPAGKKRLFRRHFATDKPLSQEMQVFAPAIRDSSLFNGLNHILQRIEFNVGLAYGTISEPADIEKTAEEIRTSKQRSYVQVSKMQRALRSAFEHLLYAMDVYTTLYELAPEAEVTLRCTWGDSVLEDFDKEYSRRLQMVSAGLLSKEQFVMWYFNCDETKAAEYLPKIEPLFGGGGNAITI